jgi:hypothetical protein
MRTLWFVALSTTALCACAPALTLKRLERPKLALGDVQTISIAVAPNAQLEALTFPGEQTRVLDFLRDTFTSELRAAFKVCATPGCGDGELRLEVETFAFEEAMTESFASTAALTVRMVFTPAAGGRPWKSAPQMASRGPSSPGERMKAMIHELAKDLVEEVRASTPLHEMPVEGGGPLDAGVRRLHEADWAGAAALFETLTREHPEFDGAWFDLGFALEAQNKWVSALAAYEEAARRAPKPHYEAAVRELREMLTRRR